MGQKFLVLQEVFRISAVAAGGVLRWQRGNVRDTVLRISSAQISRPLLLWGCVGFLLTAFAYKRYILDTETRFLTGTFTEAGAIAFFVSDFFFAFMLVLWLWQGSWRRAPSGFLFFFLAALAVWSVLRASFSDIPLLGLYHAGRLIQGILLLFMTADIVRRGVGTRLLLSTLVILGVSQALLGGYQVLRGTSVGIQLLGEPVLRLQMPGVAKVDLPSGEKLLRAYGTLPHPNVLGGLLVATIVATGVLQGILASGRKVLLPVLIGVQIAGLFLTFSRSALASLLTLVLFYFILRYKKVKSQVLLLLFVLVPVLLSSVPSVRSAFLSRVVPPETDQFLSERIRALGEAWLIFREHPVVGVGPGQLIPALTKRVPVGTRFEPWQYEYPHVVPMVIATELGVIGFALVVLIWLSLAWSARFHPGVFWGISLSLVFPLLFDHYLWTIQPGRILLWGAFGVLQGLILAHSLRNHSEEIAQ